MKAWFIRICPEAIYLPTKFVDERIMWNMHKAWVWSLPGSRRSLCIFLMPVRKFYCKMCSPYLLKIHSGRDRVTLSHNCHETPTMKTICDAQYQTAAIFPLGLSTIGAITVRIAITDCEFYNSTNNSAIPPSIQAVHPTVFQLSCFNNSPNSTITQTRPPP